MNLRSIPISIGIAAGICGIPLIARAENVVLQVAKFSDKATANCPSQVILTETSKRHEGGYTRNGQANLQWLAGKFAIATTDAFSVTWVATLKPQYNNCTASAGISSKNRASLPHLRMRFIDAKVFLILDMTGMRDANGFTPSIIAKSAKNGIPVWQWGGTD